MDKAARNLGEQGRERILELAERIGLQATEIYIDRLHEWQANAERYQKTFSDLGSFSAALGYDAINAEGHGLSGSYTVVLNRSKVIMSEERVAV